MARMQAVMAPWDVYGMTKALDGDGWIVADGDEGGHVEGASYRSATPHDDPPRSCGGRGNVLEKLAYGGIG